MWSVVHLCVWVGGEEGLENKLSPIPTWKSSGGVQSTVLRCHEVYLLTDKHSLRFRNWKKRRRWLKRPRRLRRKMAVKRHLPMEMEQWVSVEYFPAGLVAFVREYSLVAQVSEGPFPLLLFVWGSRSDTDASCVGAAHFKCSHELGCTWL